jgi:drug/metabolite transporter, DME family
LLPSPETRRQLSGTAFCLASALAYTAVNIVMRQLATLQCDPVWAVFNRELVTAAVVGSWLLWQAIRGRPTLPSGTTLWRLLLVGLLIQVVGNVCAQWSLGVVGLAITIPAVFGLLMTGGAVLGHFWLGERVSVRSMAAIALLLASLVLLGQGAESAGRSIAGSEAVEANPIILTLAVAAAGLAGAVFAVLNITIRHSVTRTTLPMAIAFLIPMTGVISLGPICIFRLGIDQLAHTPWEQLALMAAAGLFNLIGFVALIHGLQRTTVVHANALNASQVAMASVAGIALFHESPNPWLLVGVCLTIVGTLWIERPADAGSL